MSYPASTSRTQAGLFSRPRGKPEGRPDPLPPLLAGAHARGMADALELARIPAVLIDARGMVLHVGAAATALFGPALRVEYDHLVGVDGESTRAIQNLILGALTEGPMPVPVRLKMDGQGALILQAQRVQGAAGNCSQLLKVLILIEESHESEASAGALVAAFEGRRGIRET